MKKIIALLLALTLVLGLVACGNQTNGTDNNNTNNETNNQVDNNKENEDDKNDDTVKVMTWAEYDAAAMDSEVIVEVYVQAHQSWWDGKITVYAQDKDGAYFIYNMACTEEDAAKLTEGTKIRVKGYKGEWSGEIEIMDATFEFVEGADKWVAEAEDVTEILASEDLIKHQNKFVAFKGMTVEASQDANGNNVAFLYSWDGSGEEGSDLYFKVTIGGATYTFCVESYLCGPGTDVYEAVKALEVGDVIDAEGFLYWYEGAQPHITKVTVQE